MVRLVPLPLACFIFLLVGLSGHIGRAERAPADALLPDTTKCYLSIADLRAVGEKWGQTGTGAWVAQPALKPFVEDVLQQFQANMSLVRRLGTDWRGLKQLKIKGVDWAIVQPDNDPEQVAVALIGTVEDGQDAAQVLAALLAQLTANDATLSHGTWSGQPLHTVTWPRQGPYGRARSSYFLTRENAILASDRQEILTAMVRRQSDETGSLRQFKPYAEIQQRCGHSQLDPPDIEWFVEPFGFAESLRAANGGRRQRGRDFLKILPRQGFSAIQGLGGTLRIHYQDFDQLTQAYIYAPAAPGQSATATGDRFVKAARMLSFPNHDDSVPLSWIPADVGSYITLRCRLGDAFEHSKSLVDDLASQPVFEDVLKSIELDPNGPQVNLREAIVRHLGQRVVVLTEARATINADGEPQGGRVAGVAIELTDPQAVEKSLAKIMASDPTARRVEHDGTVLWVMTALEDESAGGEGFDSFASDDFASDDDFAQDGTQLFPDRVFLVGHDHLIVTTSEALAKKLLGQTPQSSSLARSARYGRVRQTLTALGSGQDCFRFYVRTAKLLESTYRQVRLSERFDLFDDFGLLMEKVWVSGDKLPPYEDVATELGDSGVFVHAETDGWKIVGFLLKNENLP